MYCVTHHNYSVIRGNYNNYLCYADDSDNIVDGYFFVQNKETYLQNLSNHSKKHPTVFKTKKQAKKFIEWFIKESPYTFHRYDFDTEFVSYNDIPKCDMNCRACNKKRDNKFTCKHLRNKYQNLCRMKMGKFDDDFVPNMAMLDVNCKSCKTQECSYHM